MVGHSDNIIYIVHADMAFTRSKVKEKVTGLLKFQKLHRHFSMELKTVG